MPQETELVPGLAATIDGIDLTTVPEKDEFDYIARVWRRYPVLVFPNQDITTEQQTAFAEAFGPLQEVRPAAGRNQPDYVLYISNQPPVGDERVNRNGNGELHFHMDQTYRKDPNKATFLYGLEVPSDGGQTLFNSTVRGYQALPDELKNKIAQKWAIFQDDNLHCEHPLVARIPETGDITLFVCRAARKVIDMDDSESCALLETLCGFNEDPKYRYTHNWNVKDLVMWDNRRVLHARSDFDPTERRVLRRLTIKGEEVIPAMPAKR